MAAQTPTYPEAETSALLPQPDRGRTAFGRRFVALFALGLLGIAALIPILGPALERAVAAPGAPPLPYPLLVVVSLIQPAILLAVAVAVGIRLAPRLGLRSHVAERAGGGDAAGPPFAQEISAAFIGGTAAAVALLLLDLAFQPAMGAEWAAAVAGQSRTVAVTLAGVLYGGITEELLTRWGLVSLLAWIGWRLRGRSATPPRASTMWVAIGLAALLFGVGHLPAVAMLVPLTGVIVLRTVLLNAVGGIIFGWLYWRRSLEAAMLAHATTHVVLSVVTWGGLLGASAA